jgi:subtilisin family serine protease
MSRGRDGQRARRRRGVPQRLLQFLERCDRPAIAGRGRAAIEPLEARLVLSLSPIAPAWFERLDTSTTAGGGIGAADVGDQSTIDWQGQATSAVADQWIVQLKQSALENITSIAQAGLLLDGDVNFDVLSGLGRVGQLLVSTTASVGAVTDWLGTLDAVSYFEPNFVSSVSVLPNDTQLGSLWGLNNTGQSGGVVDADIDAPEAWEVSTGSSSIVVAVIDTGVSYTHPDLADNMWRNPGETAGNGIDDDGNGFIDDIYGWDFVNNDSNPMDDNKHGTHVAGTIAAEGNNSSGVVGVNWNSSIMALKFLSSGGSGTTANAILSVNYATMMRELYGVNVRVASNSWGGGPFSQGLFDAISNMNDAGILFVAAAGNSADNADVSPHYPAAYNVPNVISVAATDRFDQLASFSTYGLNSVDLGAPGVDILSTVLNGGYSSLSGTSMATPHVSGVAALAWSIAPNATVSEVKAALLGGVDPIPALAGKTVTGGRLNAAETIARMGVNVASSTPATNSTVGSPPTTFTLTISTDIDPLTVDPSDLVVNGLTADTVTVLGPRTLEFTFATSPVTTEGVQTMSVAAGAFQRADGALAVRNWTSQFTYDVLPTAVVATSIAEGAVVTQAPTVLTIQYNEALDPASVAANDLRLNYGSAVSASLIAPDTIQFNLVGVPPEKTVTYSLVAGAIRDLHGAPALAYSGSFVVDDPNLTIAIAGGSSIAETAIRSYAINVTTAATISDLDLRLALSATNLASTEVRLVAPNGVRVVLIGAGQLNAAIATILDDAASSSIATATAPYAPSYRPVGALAAFNGMSTQGIWKIELRNITGASTFPTLGLGELWFRSDPITAPPQVTYVLPLDRSGGATWTPTDTLVVGFSRPLDPITASQASNWSIIGAGTDQQLGTGDDVTVPVVAVPNGATVTLTTQGGPLNVGQFRLVAHDAITDTSFQALDGDRDGLAGGDYQRDFAIAARITVNSNVDDFETGTLPPWWEPIVSPAGTVTVSSASPNQGQYSLALNHVATSTSALESIIHADLAGQAQVFVDMRMRASTIDAKSATMSIYTGSTWQTVATLPAATLEYGHYSFNLSNYSQYFSADTRLKLSFNGEATSPYDAVSLYIDDFRLTTDDVFGPRVTGTTTLTRAADADPLASITVTFSEAMNESTFAGPGGFSLTDPLGRQVAIDSITPVEDGAPNQYVVSFTPQSVRGLYTLTVGKNVTDAAGNPMNQDNDAQLGGIDDTGSVKVTYLAQTLTITEPFVEDFEWDAGVPTYWQLPGSKVDLINTENPNGTDMLQLYGSPTRASAVLNLSNLAGRDDLTLDLYETTHIVTSSVTIQLRVIQGSKSILLLSHSDSSGSSTQHFGFDLDAFLTTNAFDLQQPLTFEFYTGASQAGSWYGLDNFRISTADVVSPRVVGVTPNGTGVALPLTTFDVEFSEAIDPTTFDAADITLTGPLGAISLASAPTPVGSDGKHFTITLATPYYPAGAYTLTVTSNLSDLLGNLLDQNANGLGGESSDSFTTTLQAVSPPVQAFPYVESFDSPAPLAWTLTKSGGGAFGINATSTPHSGAANLRLTRSSSSGTVQGYFGVDLSTAADPASLGLDFWALKTASSTGNASTLLSLSNDAATWVGVPSFVINPTSTTQWSQYHLDLDQAIAAAGLNANGVVYIRFEALPGSATYGIALDDLRVADGDIDGALVTGITANPTVQGLLPGFTVSFSEAINAASLAAGISIKGPGGSTLPIAGTPTNVGPPGTYQVNFATPQSLGGTYTVSIAPTVVDLAGNALNPNQDQINGGPTDTDSATFELLPAAVAPPYTQSFEPAAPVPPVNWQVSTTGTGVVEISNANTPQGTQHLLMRSTSSTSSVATAQLKLDLTSHSADSLFLDFWAKRSTNAQLFSVSVSGDGSTWSTVTSDPYGGATTSTSYAFMSLDLGQALTSAGIALDADVYVRWSTTFTSNSRWVAIDDVAVSTQDHVGPQALWVSPTMVGSALSAVIVMFNEPIDAATFTASDVVINGPANSVPLAIVGNPVDSGDHRMFTITLAQPQSIRQDYVIKIGPDVRDLAGNKMNQDGDLAQNESTDFYTITTQLPVSTAVLPVVYDFESGQLGDLTNWFFTSASGNVSLSNANSPHGNYALRFDDQGSSSVTQTASFLLDLSGQAAATDLVLDFWAQQLNSSSGNIAIQLSGDGINWQSVSQTVILGILGQYTYYAIDLDQAFTTTGIVRDATTYVRFAFTKTTSTASRMTIDDVRVSQGNTNLTPLVPIAINLPPGIEDQPVTSNYAALIAAGFSDPEGSPLDVLVHSVLNGGTLLVNGAAAVAGVTRLYAGDNLVFVPPANANGSIPIVNLQVSDGVNTSQLVPVKITLSAVNDAPVLNPALLNQFPNVLANSTNHAGTMVGTLLGSGGAFSDPDGSGSSRGIAIVGRDPAAQGTWQYSTSGSGGPWTAIPAVAESSAFLLSEGSYLRFVPATGWIGQATLTIRAWDRSAGSNATSVNIVSPGSGSPYSIATGTLNLRVASNPPTGVTTGGPYNTYEGQPLTLTATGTDPDGDPLTFTWDINADGVYTDAVGQSVTLTASELAALQIDGPQSLTIRVRATDPSGAFTTSNAGSLLVQSVAPVASASLLNPTPIYRGDIVTLALAATDASPVDQAGLFTFQINWGDGTPFENVVGLTGINATHRYAAPGSYQVTINALDADGAISTGINLSVAVASRVQLQPNAHNGALTDLVWTGSAGSDQVVFEQVDATTIRVRELRLDGGSASFVDTYTGVTGLVIAKGLAGDDILDGSLLDDISAKLDGGAGNNTLYGGGAGDILIGGGNVAPKHNGPEGQQGSNIIVGGGGDDFIYGNAINGAEGKGGNNILLGGDGNDTIYGNWTDGGEGGGRNIIVGGADADTLYDYKIADGAEGKGSILVADELNTSLGVPQLQQIMAEWASNHSYSDRVNNILGPGSVGRLNGNAYLQPGTTVTSDAAIDQLWGSTGGAAYNWFWYVLAVDEINRTKGGETHSVL